MTATTLGPTSTTKTMTTRDFPGTKSDEATADGTTRESDDDGDDIKITAEELRPQQTRVINCTTNTDM